MNEDLAVPASLRVEYEHELGWFKVMGGAAGNLVVAVFPSELAAEHFVRYCVEFDKTFAGVRP